MESWEHVFRHGLSPSLTLEGLQALAHAIEADDEHLIQGATTEPPALNCTRDWFPNGCCAVAYAVWKGSDASAESVNLEYIEEGFAEASYQCGKRLNESSSVRYFLNWYDQTPRNEMRALLLPVVRDVIQRRKDSMVSMSV